MGSSFSATIKAKSPLHNGADSKYGCKDRNGFSASSRKVSATNRTEGEILQSSNLKRFSFNELKTATRNFSTDVAESRFGFVFKGWIDEQSLTAAEPGTSIVIAVMTLNRESFLDHKKWLTEINYQEKLYHPNLVKLIGYCLEDDHLLLAYEFVANGSLENYLFKRSSYFQPLSWNLRVKVALGAAKALAFLHSDQVNVIYSDIKTTNILVDSNYNAKLCNFWLAKDGPTGDRSHVSTRAIGTYGCADPHYMATGHLSAKSDVYCFGVVLLELLFGRQAIDRKRPFGEQNLVEWSKPYLTNKRKIFQVLDARIKDQYKFDETMKVANLAIQCLSTEPNFRPSMEQVVRALEQLQDTSGRGLWNSK